MKMKNKVFSYRYVKEDGVAIQPMQLCVLVHTAEGTNEVVRMIPETGLSDMQIVHLMYVCELISKYLERFVMDKKFCHDDYSTLMVPFHDIIEEHMSFESLKKCTESLRSVRSEIPFLLGLVSAFK